MVTGPLALIQVMVKGWPTAMGKSELVRVTAKTAGASDRATSSSWRHNNRGIAMADGGPGRQGDGRQADGVDEV